MWDLLSHGLLLAPSIWLFDECCLTTSNQSKTQHTRLDRFWTLSRLTCLVHELVAPQKDQSFWQIAPSSPDYIATSAASLVNSQPWTLFEVSLTKLMTREYLSK
jgi:hypothetical protein